MKGRSLILIFLFLCILPISSAENSTFYFNLSSSSSNDGSLGSPVNTIGVHDAITHIRINDAQAFQGANWIIHTGDDTNWDGSSANSAWTAVEYKIGGTVVATGTFGFNKGANTYHVGAFFDDEDQKFSDYSGAQIIEISGSLPTCRWATPNPYTYYTNTFDTTSADIGYLIIDYNNKPMQDASSGSESAESSTSISYDFSNKILYDSFGAANHLWVEKQSQNSRYNVSNDYETFFYEPSVNTDDQYVKNIDLANSTWTVEAWNAYGDYFSKAISFTTTASGTIELNQTNYVDPENIEVEWNIQYFDDSNYNYLIQMTATLDGDVSGNFWEAQGNWNISQYVSLASGAAVFDFYSDGYDLSVWIQGELWAQDTNTGIWTMLDSTPAVIYHESAVQGQIWTDKSNYNVTELVEIWYTTNVAENYIAVEEPYSLWSTHDVPVGTYSFMYELSTSAVGNTTIYLFENSEQVDQVTISVSSESGDDAYAAWMKDYYFEGETASFYYYSSNASAQITVYDGADIIVFGPATTQLGYHNGRVNTANTNPGTFLLSLYHNGTYYNDTMIFESVDSWVRFDSSKYYVGDTINIEYYLADPRHAISMWDAHQKLVIRFTTEHGRIVSGSMETVSFTLSENNEYSYDILGRLNSGYHTLGYWKIFIEDEYGALDSWDEAYVCNATDDDDGSYGTDTSNEMISIFFSPEGIFLLFTVALTMMGLVAAKHPAGGGAGATVGVGFGVYFNVLPVWMLMLTVILLVVMAGVSIAVYYKGK